ncbi:MAG: hypothetical protein U9Q08_04085, partial [Candidatus Omnitrophota bacterium]|nr:hypothetical protein [Candidatus Omnitrophota bacterium]
RKILKKDWYRILSVQTVVGAEALTEIKKILTDYKTEIRDTEVARAEQGKLLSLKMDLKLLTDRHDDRIISDIIQIKGVKKAGWK